MDVSVNGGASHTFYNGGVNSYTGSVQADGSNVYWVDRGLGTVVQSPIESAGSTIITLAQGYNPHSLVIDSTYAYWTDVNLNEVFRSTLGAAGTPTVLSTNSSPSYTIATNCPALPGTCDAADVYWNGGTSTNLMSLALNNGSPAGVPSPLVAGPELIDSIVTDLHNVYWFSNVGGVPGMPGVYYYNLYDMPLAGGSVVTLALNQIETRSIITDGTYIYWTNQSPDMSNSGTVNRTLIAGKGEVVPNVLSTGNPASLAQDTTSIYWTVNGTTGVNSGSVWKLAK
jgi:hypothetical protein